MHYNNGQAFTSQKCQKLTTQVYFLPFAGVNSVRVMGIITERCSDVPMALTLTTTCYDLQITIPELHIQPSSTDAPWLLLLKCACQPTA